MRATRILRPLTMLFVVGVLTACGQTIIPPTPLPDWMMTTVTVERVSMSESVSIFGQVTPTEGLQLTYDIVDGRVLQVFVSKGQTVSAGDELVRLDTTATERLLHEAEADLVVAQAELDAASSAVSAVEIAKGEAALAAAEQQVVAAKLTLDTATAAGTEALEQAVADAQYALQAAKDAYAARYLEANQQEIRRLEYQQAFFERTLRDLAPGADPTEAQTALDEVKGELAAARRARAQALTSAQEAIAEAERGLALAQSALADVTSGTIDATANERLAYQRAVLARDQAAAKLEELRSGGDPARLEAAQTAYDAALAKVDSYKASIEAATLKAPIDGAILDLYVKPNDWASASTPIAYLADPGLTHIQARVSEVDVVRLAVGQTVRVSFDALPGKLVAGEVASVDQRATEEMGLVTYLTEIVLDQAVPGLIQGMSATVRVLVGERDNVVAVPSVAVQYDPMGQPFVYVRSDDGAWVNTPVELGMNDGIMVEVLSGVEVGQTVRIPVSLETPVPEEGGGGVVPER